MISTLGAAQTVGLSSCMVQLCRSAERPQSFEQEPINTVSSLNYTHAELAALIQPVCPADVPVALVGLGIRIRCLVPNLRLPHPALDAPRLCSGPAVPAGGKSVPHSVHLNFGPAVSAGVQSPHHQA